MEVFRLLRWLYGHNAGLVTIAAFTVVAAGPIYQLAAFAIDTGHFSWMQTAYDEPFYINDALNGPLSFGQRTLSQVPAHFIRALGIVKFDTVAIISNFVLSLFAFSAAWVLAGTLTDEALERVCWTLALAFGFQFFSLNSPFISSPTLAQHLERLIVMQWLFAADLFPYFGLYRTPEPQTTWIPFFLYLALLVRFAGTLDLRFYRLLCFLTPLFVFCYVTPAITAWLLFVMLSMYSIAFLRLRLKLAFVISSLITCGLLFAVFQTGNAKLVSVSIYNSHLPIFRMSIVFALAGLCYFVFELRRNKWQLNGRLALACACAIIPIVTLNQQILTGKVIIAQQWELFSNYICLVLAFGLLATLRRTPSAPRSRFRPFAAGVVFLAMIATVIAGHIYTYRAFLPVNLMSVAEARIYRQIAERREIVSAIVLTHFWDDFLFRIRVPDAPPVLGGGTWLMQHPLPPVIATESPETYLARNAELIAVGFELSARRELTPEALREELQAELTAGVCWPMSNYFFSVHDCWYRFSNYRENPLQRLTPWIEPIVRRYEEYLRALRSANAGPPVILISGAPIEQARLLGLWTYQPLGTFRTAAEEVSITLYAYIQTKSVRSTLSIGPAN